MNGYEQAALAECRRRGFEAAHVRGLEYGQVATLAGVVVDVQGGSPADFFYESVRAAVANVLEYEHHEERQGAAQAAIQEQIRTALGWRNAEVSRDDEGNYRVELHGAEFERERML